VLYVTQDYKEAMALADRIAVIANGKFIQTAAPEDIYLKPATLGVAQLFGDPSINTADTRVEMAGKTVNVTLGGVKVPIDSAYKQDDDRDVTFGVVRKLSRSMRGSAGLMAKVMAVTPLNERTVLLLHRKGLGIPGIASLFRDNIPDRCQVKAPSQRWNPSLDKTTAERLHG
jgi:multiple sugar transport system ATP-binding protein